MRAVMKAAQRSVIYHPASHQGVTVREVRPAAAGAQSAHRFLSDSNPPLLLNAKNRFTHRLQALKRDSRGGFANEAH